jgi:H+-transporting ATPase
MGLLSVVQTIVFLQLVAGGHLLLVVVGSRGPIFRRPWPSMPLFLAVAGTQLLAVMMCGFGWFVPPLGGGSSDWCGCTCWPGCCCSTR